MKFRPVEMEFLHADGRTDGHDQASRRFFVILRMRLKKTTMYFCKNFRFKHLSEQCVLNMKVGL
jgi:hypothetical protein